MILNNILCHSSKLTLIKHFEIIMEVWDDFQVSQDYNIKNKKEK